jgi:hypothetical protein
MSYASLLLVMISGTPRYVASTESKNLRRDFGKAKESKESKRLLAIEVGQIYRRGGS